MSERTKALDDALGEFQFGLAMHEVRGRIAELHRQSKEADAGVATTLTLDELKYSAARRIAILTVLTQELEGIPSDKEVLIDDGWVTLKVAFSAEVEYAPARLCLESLLAKDVGLGILQRSQMLQHAKVQVRSVAALFGVEFVDRT